jgi:hypothetical protein
MLLRQVPIQEESQAGWGATAVLEMQIEQILL